MPNAIQKGITTWAVGLLCIGSLTLVGCENKPANSAAGAKPTAASTATTTSSSAAATSSTAVSNTAPAGTGDLQKEREKTMKEWGNANKTMGGMIKDPTTFKADEFKAAAAKLDQDPWAKFTADSKHGRSKDEVWSKADEYKAEIEKYKTAVAALNAAAQTATSVDAVKEQFGAVGATCKSCHEGFRKPE